MVMGGLVLLHALLALACGLAGRRLGRNVLWVAALGPLATLTWLTTVTGGVLDGTTVVEQATWAPTMGLALELQLDGLGLLFWWLIAGIGLLVFAYATRYFGRRNDLGRFTAMLVLFAGAMLLLTAADNVFVLFVAWELTSVTSYLLIGFDDRSDDARASALQALLITGLGGLALLGGLVLLSTAAGTTSLSGVLTAAPSGPVAQGGLVLVLLAAATKSAQAPFHFWLPGAMAAPTPVSAYLHSATMVKAGIYVLARVGPAFGPEVDWWGPAVLAVGATSMIVGGYKALAATDLKALLAYGTVSQLGFIVLLIGHGDPGLAHAGVALLLAHALFKATLFMVAGVVDHQAHTRDLRRLTGLGRRMPAVAAAGVIATASMAGVFPLFGFISKEAALEASMHAGVGGPTMTALIVAGSALTAAYGLRFLWGAFATKPAADLTDPVPPTEVARPPWLFAGPAALLTVLTVAFGLWVGPADVTVEVAAAALTGHHGDHLALWHGVGPALGLSLLALATGFVIFRSTAAVTAVGRVTGRAPSAQRIYRRSVPGLLSLAGRVTGIVQSGSLPVYATTVLAVAVALPLASLAGGFGLPDTLVLSESPLQTAVGALIVVAAVAAAATQRRLGAVLLVGAVGYGVAVLFVLQGAPDLALTQMLIETLALAVFVLVLRRLPDRFGHHPRRISRAVRLAVSGAVGLFFGAFTLATVAGRVGTSPAADFLARAKPDGGGKNVVNVILTDFRALDTFGEVTVLLTAAVGIGLLVRTRISDRDKDAR